MGIKYFFTFVVRDTLKINSNDKIFTTKKTEQNYWGSVLVQVHSLFRCLSFDVSRSDYPSLFNQIFNDMRDTKRQSTTSASENGTFVSEIQNNHTANRQSVINNLFERPINQLVNDFLVGMDAKNKAYYFILESGMFMQFRDYCLTNQNRG